MAEDLTAGEKLDRALNEKSGHEDIVRLEAKIDQLLQAMQNFSGRMEGRMDEISRQLAAKR